MSIVSYYIILVILGLLPSAIWLTYYLRKDCHPEPKALIVKTFLMGIIVSPLVIAAGFLVISIASRICSCQINIQDSRFLLWAAFVEEIIKFYAVKLIALNSNDFDEPVDAMIYMITAGLGFAAMENILYLSRTIQDGVAIHATLGMHAQATLSVWLLRFTGATLLHTLSSDLLGYFLAISWFFQHHRRRLFFIGLILATIFHFTFNILVSTSFTPESWDPINRLLVNQAYSVFLLIGMAFLISILFDKIKERNTTNTTLV